MMAAAKKTTSGLGARMAAKPADPVAAGMAAVLGPSTTDEAPSSSKEVVALNVRMPKSLHRELRQLAFNEETSITALLLEAAEVMLQHRRGEK